MREPKRDFIFIDEAGDPGPGGASSSNYFIAACVHITDARLPRLLQHFVNLRYFSDADGELKPLINNPRLRPRLIDVLRWHAEDGSASFSAVQVDKREYTGPYLRDTGPKGRDSRRFMNRITRHLLEGHLSLHKPESPQCELVIDRVTMTLEQELNLRRYLQDNWKLPSFEHITLADSRYVEGLQIADLVASLVREIVVDGNEKYGSEDVSFINCRDISTLRG